MRSYPFIEGLFKSVLAQSKAIQGRLFLCPNMGLELNADNLGVLMQDLQIPENKEIPALALLMPPVSMGDYIDSRTGEWDEHRFIMFFLKPTYYDGKNQVSFPNESTGTSTHSIPMDWHDMKRCAINFIRVLSRVQKSLGLINASFRLSSERKRTITPVSSISTRRYSGVRLDFAATIYNDCNLEDYTAEGIEEITVNIEDSHPEHQL